MRGRREVLLVSCLGVLVLLMACSSGPPPVKMGTPAWYWNAANEQFTAGDLIKTQEHLEKVVASNDPLKSKAAIWHLVMSAGMALGYKDLAEAYADGSTQTKTQAGEFRRRAGDALRLSRQYCVSEAQELESFLKDTGGATDYVLEFDFPSASPSEDPALGRIKKGLLPPEEEMIKGERMTVKRGVLLETAMVVGAGDDTAKTAALFEKRPVKIGRAVFLYGLAESLLEQSQIFERKRLNEPDKRKILLQMAFNCVKPAADSGDADLKKKAKALQDKIAKEQKTLPKSV